MKKNVYFICDGNNKLVVEAVKNSLSKIPVEGFLFTPFICDQEKYKLSIDKGISETAKVIENLLNNFDMTVEGDIVYAVDIKETIDFGNDGNGAPRLICVVSMVSKDETKFSSAMSYVNLPNELKSHLLSGKEIPEALNYVFDDGIDEHSLYEHITKKNRLNWYEETVFKTLLF